MANVGRDRGHDRGAGFGPALLWHRKRFRLGLWLLVFSLVSAWAIVAAHDLVALRHFAGAGFGVLAMAVVARWCTGTDRIVAAGSAFAVVSIGILLAGLVGAVSNLTTSKFFPFNLVLTHQQMMAAAGVGLPIPGLEKGLRVNPNALGGTGVLVLPMCAGLMAAALAGERRRRLPLAIGCTSTTVAAAVLVITQSRTARAAALLTLALLGLCWRRGRLWVVLGLVALAAGLAAAVHYWRAADPAAFDFLDGQHQQAHHSVGSGEGRLKESPRLGISINAFRGAETGGGESGEPHAHNIWLQTALDVGLLGLLGYASMLGALVREADRLARRSGEVGCIAAGAGLSLVGVHVFGITDAIALGAKVGIFQWLCAGLILAAVRQPALSSSPECAAPDAQRPPLYSRHPSALFLSWFPHSRIGQTALPLGAQPTYSTRPDVQMRSAPSSRGCGARCANLVSAGRRGIRRTGGIGDWEVFRIQRENVGDLLWPRV